MVFELRHALRHLRLSPGFTAASGRLAGLRTARRLVQPGLRPAFHEGGCGAPAGGGPRQILVGAQMALTLVLLGVSGLIPRSLEWMRSASLGFDDTFILNSAIALAGLVPACRAAGVNPAEALRAE